MRNKPNNENCQCNKLMRVAVGQTEFRGLRCPHCVDAILEAKNEVIRENYRLLKGDFTPEELQGLCHNLTTQQRCEFEQGCKDYQDKLFGVTS